MWKYQDKNVEYCLKYGHKPRIAILCSWKYFLCHPWVESLDMFDIQHKKQESPAWMCRVNFFSEWCAIVTTNDAFTFLWTLSGDIIIFPFRLPSLFDLKAVKRALARFCWRDCYGIKASCAKRARAPVHLDPMRRSLKFPVIRSARWTSSADRKFEKVSYC
jgi:hypothetical protein